MPNSFLSGFTGGAQLGLRLRDYDKNVQRQQNQDRMAQESHATQQQQAGLQMDVLRGQMEDRSQLRGLGELEYSLQSGTPTPNAQRAYENMFKHYGDNIDQAEADVTELERAASTGDADENTRQALNRVYADEINKGGPKNAYKEIADVWPTENGVSFDLKVTRPDGSTYIAPMTSPNRDEKDTQVAAVPWDTLFTDIKARKAAIDLVRGRRVGLGDTAPLTALQTAETKQVERQQGLEDFVFKEDYKRRSGTGKSAWGVTSLGDGRFIMYNKQTGERRVPTAEEMQSLGGAGGKVQTVTFTDDQGNKVPMERRPDGSWVPIRPEGEQDQTGIGPGGMTWVQAEERAKQEAGGFLGFGRDEEAVTRRAQELYQGAAQGATPAVGLQIEQPPAQPAAPPQAARRQPTAQPPQIDRATIQRAMGNPDAMREVLRQLNPGASPQEIEAGVAAALQNQPAGASGVIQR